MIYMAKVKTAEYFEIDHYEFNNIVRMEYGHEYHFHADQEACNYTDHVFYVDGMLTKYCQDKLKRWKETGEGHYMAAVLINDMAARGKIKRGNWIVRVSW